MSKHVVYVAMNEDAPEWHDASVYRKEPRVKLVGAVPAKPAGLCSCGAVGCTVDPTPAQPAVSARREFSKRGVIADLCRNGLKSAGIRYTPGEILKLTITATPVKPKAKRKTAKRK